MKSIINKLSRQINQISKLNGTEGKLTINVEKFDFENYNDFENKIENILSNIIIPDGYTRSEHFIYNKDIEICIFFK